MAKQTFTAGQVLTAAQQNSLQGNDYNQTVSTKTASYTLVAADAGTRVVMNAAGATTITVNTSLFSAGDTLVLQNIGAGTCTVTAGTATVSSAGPLAIPQYGSGTLYFTSTGVSIYFPSAVTAAGGLVLISATTIPSAVSSFTVSSAFSSTYDNYKILISGGTASTDHQLNLTLGATATGYYLGRSAVTYSTGATSVDNQNNASSWVQAGDITTTSLGMNVDLLGPNLAKKTYIFGARTQARSDQHGGYCSGFLDDTTQYTAFTVTAGSGTITGGTCRVYGFANS